MGETIAVLFIFFILLIGGFMFYAKVQKTSIGRDVEERSELDAIDIAQKASFLPELQCSYENVPRMNCVDMLKLEAMDAVTSERPTLYYDQFFFSHIYVAQIYPSDPDNNPGTPPPSWTVYENIKEDWTSNITTHIPVSIYDPVGYSGAGQTNFGVLVVEVLR